MYFKIKRIQLRVKTRFKNSLTSGEKYQSENILEIVKVSEAAIYFKATLNFFNGHSCGIFGVADYRSNGKFVYDRSSENEEANICRFAISLVRNTIHFDDLSSVCKARYCGARGTLEGDYFQLKVRRPIKYMKIILNSKDYKQSLESFNAPK